MTNFFCWRSVELVLTMMLPHDVFRVPVQVRDRAVAEERDSFVMYVGCSVYPGGIWIGDIFPRIPEQNMVVAEFPFVDVLHLTGILCLQFYSCSVFSFYSEARRGGMLGQGGHHRVWLASLQKLLFFDKIDASASFFVISLLAKGAPREGFGRTPLAHCEYHTCRRVRARARKRSVPRLGHIVKGYPLRD